MIKEYRALTCIERLAILELVSKDNTGIEIIDQFEESGQCLYIKFITRDKGIIRCTLLHLTHEQAAAFRFPDSTHARTIMKECLRKYK